MTEDHADYGIKLDDGKPHASIAYCQFPVLLSIYGLTAEEINAVTQAAMYGEKKYPDRFNWRMVPNASQRYIDAGYRHLDADMRGELVDEESDLPHTYHVLWNACAVMELILEGTADSRYLPAALKLLRTELC